MVFEETELRLGLGLPGGNGVTVTESSTTHELTEGVIIRKRGFSESTETTTTMDLMLNLSPKEGASAAAAGGTDDPPKTSPKEKNNTLLLSDSAKPPAKVQVVGWPPVRSFRKNMFTTQKSSGEESNKNSTPPSNVSSVKVIIDGAPYLRKIDLKIYNDYTQFSEALGKMFNSFTVGNCESEGFKDFMNESKMIDLLNSADYVSTYEDKDGDWMLVGDVPWEMFVESCKRLRIMKGKEAIGLAPKAMVKCKNPKLDSR